MCPLTDSIYIKMDQLSVDTLTEILLFLHFRESARLTLVSRKVKSLVMENNQYWCLQRHLHTSKKVYVYSAEKHEGGAFSASCYHNKVNCEPWAERHALWTMMRTTPPAQHVPTLVARYGMCKNFRHYAAEQTRVTKRSRKDNCQFIKFVKELARKIRTVYTGSDAAKESELRRKLDKLREKKWKSLLPKPVTPCTIASPK